jgi:hypothetical protein
LVAALLFPTMIKLISAALLAGGIVLIVYGVNASNAFSSSVSRAVTGEPTDRAMWLLIGGIAAAAMGAVGLFRGQKNRS